MLMASSYPNRTSPVLRGAWMLENIIGTPPATPPPNVEALPEARDRAARSAHGARDASRRTATNPTCFACHGVMDPLGFALENFDAVGAWRDAGSLRGTPIDSPASCRTARGSKARRPARGAAARPRAVRADAHREAHDVRARAHVEYQRHAGRARDRAQRRRRRLSFLVADLGDRDERSVPEQAVSAAGALRRDERRAAAEQ